MVGVVAAEKIAMKGQTHEQIGLAVVLGRVQVQVQVVDAEAGLVVEEEF
jgi:hypothetical protein